MLKVFKIRNVKTYCYYEEALISRWNLLHLETYGLNLKNVIFRLRSLVLKTNGSNMNKLRDLFKVKI